jgi:putative glutamine amidotransferase
MRPRIGITTGEIINVHDDNILPVYGQTSTYVEAVIRSGGVPHLIPLTTDVTTIDSMYELCDGIVFAGGNDVSPNLYGATAGKETGELSAKRDEMESRLMRRALADSKASLAICRGMQLLNVVRGGTLYQEISVELPDAEDHQLSTRAQDVAHLAHTLKLHEGSVLAKAAGSTSIRANTYHHQAINRLGVALRATAWSEDGLIEAIEAEGNDRMIAVQCHPESIIEAEPKWKQVFVCFVRTALR